MGTARVVGGTWVGHGGDRPCGIPPYMASPARLGDDSRGRTNRNWGLLVDIDTLEMLIFSNHEPTFGFTLM